MNADLAVFILVRNQKIAPLSIPLLAQILLQQSMPTKDGRDFGQEVYEFCIVFVEDDKSRFAISPGQISEKLINALREFGFATPDFAFRDKGGPLVILYPNVCLTRSAKGLTGYIAFVVAVEMSQKNVPQALLVMNRVCLWRSLESTALMSYYRKNMFVVFWAYARFSFEPVLGSCRQGPNQFSSDRQIPDVRGTNLAPQGDVQGSGNSLMSPSSLGLSIITSK